MMFTLTPKTLLSMTTPETIADHLFVQQGQYMAARGLRVPPVKPSQVERYAKACHALLQKQMSKCSTDADWQALWDAYSARVNMKVTQPEFIAS